MPGGEPDAEREEQSGQDGIVLPSDIEDSPNN